MYRLNLPRQRKPRAPALILLSCLMAAGLLPGCGSGPSVEGVGYNPINVAYRTVNADLAATKRAVKKALEDLGMKPGGPITTAQGTRFIATTPNLNVTVDLKRVTSKATKIFVDADVGFLQKDTSTAAEILRRTAANLAPKK
ncbi:MAG: hypothetical protein ACE5JS_16095 [Nitrospinota bacterium]